MGLFSLFRKSQQEPSGSKPSRSRAADSGASPGRAKRRTGKDGAVDPVLPEKKRARRRLIGAIALVLAAVIGLPMLLDSEPRLLASDIAIDIPAREQRARQDASRVAAADALDKDEEVIDPAPETGSRTSGTPASAGSPAPRAVAEPAPLERPAATRTEPKPEPKPEPKAVAMPPEKLASVPAKPSDDAARARALLEGRADPAADKEAGKFVIQVAALASREKVAELQDRLKEAGIKSYTQKITTQGGERTRIRVGPFGSREEAEKVRARLVKLGLSGSVVPV